MYIYLASDRPLPLVSWDEDRPAFCATELESYDLAVEKQFSKPFTVFLGAHTGCSCGFAYDNEPLEDEIDRSEDRDARESVRQLVEYLSEQTKLSSLEMFACWNGDQSDIPKSTLTVKPDYFMGAEFPIGDEPTLFLIDKVSCPT
jgi:hypothetical protein